MDVTYGPFYYTFPGRAKARVVTMHDLSFFDERFHPRNEVDRSIKLLARMAQECDAIVCCSEATLREFQGRWPKWAHKAVKIYCGVSSIGAPVRRKAISFTDSILAVGTIEPRKNYPTLLDAFERLIDEEGGTVPVLNVVGRMGWMSESVKNRLLALQAAGRCRWIQNASDAQLANAYSEATVFTYLSLCEGFGYPPFEAAYAHCPMVLSRDSSVGEIWSGHARCVDPLDVSAIVDGWKWALGLNGQERQAVVDRQLARAGEFAWTKCISGYIQLFEGLL